MLTGIQTLLSSLVNAPRPTRRVNNEHRRLSGPGTEKGPITSRLKAVEGKIANLVRSLEDGLISTELVNNRLRELARERKCCRGG